jgi:hypothetical protein
MKWTIWKVLRLLWVIAGISFLIWMGISMQAKGVSNATLQTSSRVEIKDTKDYISFTPTSTFQKVFIFYPGALVDPTAYAPLCRKIADNGYKALLIKMPWRLATKGYNKPKELGLLTDTAKQYILAGHSQGAKMAAQFVYENPSLISKLILLGTTHPRDIDLSKSQIPIMKISGSKDGVASLEDINKNKPRLPSTTKYVLIEGANHAQFGYYGYQLGDDKAGITRELQQKIVLDHILAFIK